MSEKGLTQAKIHKLDPKLKPYEIIKIVDGEVIRCTNVDMLTAWEREAYFTADLAARPVGRFPVDATTCTILGNHYKQTDAAWTGLDLARAELRKWPGDHHLGVPWQHPEDQVRFGDDPDHWAIYRVRPKMEPGRKWKGRKVSSVAFERDGEVWWLNVE